MTRIFRTIVGAAAMCALVSLPSAAQSGGGQAGGSSSGSGATDQQGSTHAAQPAKTGSKTGSGHGAAGQSSSATGASAAGATKLSSQDRTFIIEAAAGGMSEVELGRLASQKASRSEVKEFGQMMVDDHSKANDKLMKIAQEKGLAAPRDVKPQDKATEDKLSKLSGEAFDRAYMRDMVQDHQKDVASFRKHAESASDPDVKQFASSTLPTLEKHLSRAKEVEQLLGSGSARGTSGSSTSGSSTGGSSDHPKGTAGKPKTVPPGGDSRPPR
jgi:putative membrane protein